MARNYVSVPYDYLEDMEALSDAEFGRLVRALIKYSATGEQIALSGNERFYAKQVMRIEDNFKGAYTTRAENSSKGGKVKPSEAEQTEVKPSKPKYSEVKPSKTDNNKTKTKTKTNNTFPNGNERIDSDESICPTAAQSDLHKAVDAWNALGLGQVSKLTAGSDRYKLLSARLKQYGLDGWMKALDEIRQSQWLRGNGNKGWVITFDWFIRPNNFPKVHDGNYRDREEPKPFDYGSDDGYIGL